MAAQKLSVQLGQCATSRLDHDASVRSSIGDGMHFDGHFHSATGCDVYGKLSGVLSQLPGTSAAIVLHLSSTASAHVRADSVDIRGSIDGVIDNPHGVTTLRQTAAVKGTIRYLDLTVDGGMVDAVLINARNIVG